MDVPQFTHGATDPTEPGSSRVLESGVNDLPFTVEESVKLRGLLRLLLREPCSQQSASS